MRHIGYETHFMSVARVKVFEARLQALGFWAAVHRSPRPEAIPLRALD